jgi:hypothetical protein
VLRAKDETVRVAFDYYKLLGVTPQATPDELQQGLRDRLNSLPHREYSDSALHQRQQLLHLAYQHLSKQGDTGIHLDIEQEQLSGLLLLLLELGEYQQVVQLGCAELEQADAELNGNALYRIDILLSVARAYLEMAREFRQQGQYERGAQSLEMAQELLIKEGAGLNLRREIQAELYLMRPYRILELLSAPDHATAEHNRGLQLLREMLSDRRGIEGNGNDRSMLSNHDFLKFIQQLRSYMTAQQQLELFEEEAQRPSKVAAYLAVYALIAQGFATHQPALIRRAKGLLIKVGAWEDVYLEQAIANLLLGKVEEAIQLAQRTSHRDQWEIIYSKSDGGKDLLLGLCLYCEQWLREEVYPFFRDLAHKHRPGALKAYFADPAVQEYLESSQNDTDSLPQEWVRRRYPSYRPPAEPTPTSASVPTITTSARRSPPKTKSLTKARNRASASQRQRFPILVGLISLCIITLAIGIWAGRLLLNPSSSMSSIADQPSPLPSPLWNSPSPSPATLDQQSAYVLIENWQKAKSKVLGSGYEVSALEGILTEPSLSEWRRSSENLKQEDAYYQYELKSLEIKELEIKDQATARITAEISESRTFVRRGEVIPSESNPNSTYRVRYDLVKQNQQWLIQDMTAE